MSALTRLSVRPEWRPTKQVLCFEQVVSSTDIGKIVRALSRGKNKELGFYFDAEDTGFTMREFENVYIGRPLSPYDDIELYGWDRYRTAHGSQLPAFILRIYRDVLVT